MNSYREMVSDLNKFYYKQTTSIPDDSIIYENTWNIQWNNRLAIQRVYQISKILNKSPNVLGKKSGESAIWYNPKSNIEIGDYHRIEILDQAYQHTNPYRHADFIMVWFRMELKPDKAINISNISNNIFYYKLGQLVGVSCNFLADAIGAISVLKEYNDCKISLDEAKDLYHDRINNLAEEFLQSEKTEDINTFPTPLRDIMEKYIMSDTISEDVYQDSNELTIETGIVIAKLSPLPSPSSLSEFSSKYESNNDNNDSNRLDNNRKLDVLDRNISDVLDRNESIIHQLTAKRTLPKQNQTIEELSRSVSKSLTSNLYLTPQANLSDEGLIDTNLSDEKNITNASKLIEVDNIPGLFTDRNIKPAKPPRPPLTIQSHGNMSMSKLPSFK